MKHVSRRRGGLVPALGMLTASAFMRAGCWQVAKADTSGATFGLGDNLMHL